ncbi:hypothetical protein Tco_0635093 [Tanacetum coccineum]
MGGAHGRAQVIRDEISYSVSLYILKDPSKVLSIRGSHNSRDSISLKGTLMSMGRVFKTRLRRRGVKQSGEIDIEFRIADEYTVKVNKMVVTSGVDVWRGCRGVVVDGMRRLSRDSGGDGGGVVVVVDPSDEREEYAMMMMEVSPKFLAGAGGGAGFRWWPPET